MIRPVNFSFNAETAVNNAFQSEATTDAQQKAQREFDLLVSLLRDNDVEVTVIEDTPDPYTPDSIFPNNWISFHEVRAGLSVPDVCRQPSPGTQSGGTRAG